MKDDYVSVEHLFMALADFSPESAPRKSCFRPVSASTRTAVPAGPAERPRQHSASPATTPEDTYDVLEKYGTDLVERARRQEAGPGHRPGRGDPECHPHPLPKDQEQPRPHRRARRRQNGHRRRSGPADCPGRCARRTCKDKTIFSLDMGALVAGAKVPGRI